MYNFFPTKPVCHQFTTSELQIDPAPPNKHRIAVVLSKIRGENAQINDTGQVACADKAVRNASAPSRLTKAQIARILWRLQARPVPFHLPRTVDLCVLERFFQQDEARAPCRNERAPS